MMLLNMWMMIIYVAAIHYKKVFIIFKIILDEYFYNYT